MSFKSTKSKVFASIAVVGTVAAVAALVGVTSTQGGNTGSRLLQATDPSIEQDAKAFQSFVQKHNRNYLTKEEYSARLGVFSKNLGVIRAHDPVASGYKLGVNKFADLTPEEFEKMMGFKPVEDTANATTADNKFLDADGEDEEAHEEFVDNDTAEEEEEHGGRGLQSYPTSLDWRT